MSNYLTHPSTPHALKQQSLLDAFIEALQCFPGVGPKSAQRMALHLLQQDRKEGFCLATIMQRALTEIKKCTRCRALSEQTVCHLCQDTRREQQRICVVHTHYDMLAVESTGQFLGRYFVLHGALSPIDGIDGEALAVDLLVDWLQKDTIEEVILATNASAEGEMTSYYIQQQIHTLVSTISKLAQGIPTAGTLEYLDMNTLSLALQERKSFA